MFKKLGITLSAILILLCTIVQPVLADDLQYMIPPEPSQVMNTPRKLPKINLPVPNPSTLYQSLADQAKYKSMSMEERIRSVLGSNIDKVGVAYKDLNSDETITINGWDTFTAASTVKVSLAMTVYDKINKGKWFEDTVLWYSPSNYEGGTGIMQGMNLSKPFTVATLVEYMLRYSDNIATNILISNYGYENFKDYEDYLTEVPTDHGHNKMTAVGAMNTLDKLYKGRNSKPGYDKIISWLQNTIFHDRLDHDLSYGRVAHKIGNYGSNVHDIGIVFVDENPYIIAVFTNGVSGANNLITELSDVVYDRQTGQKW